MKGFRNVQYILPNSTFEYPKGDNYDQAQLFK